MSEMKPCPFCGRNGYVEPAEREGGFAVGCASRGGCFAARGYYLSEEAAIAAWNTRADDWRGMDSAPVDGTEVLIFDRNYRVVRITFWDDARGGIWSMWPGRERAYPTHWRPLPAPPVEGE